MFDPFHRSLRVKVTLGVVLPLSLILGFLFAIQYSRHETAVLDTLSLLASNSGKVIESDLRQAMLKSDFETVQNSLDAIGNSKEFRVVYLLDTKGRVIFAPRDQGVGSRLDNHDPNCQPCHHLPANARPASVVITDSSGQRVFRSMQPIANGPECARCHGSDERLLGLLLTDISMAPVEASLSSNLTENLLWGLGTILITAVVVNIALNRFVLKRLERLAAAMTGFGVGSPPMSIPESQPDEIGQLATTFKLMAQRIETREADNRILSENLSSQSAQRGELLQRLITAQEDERRRVARELHDELGQTLSALGLQTEGVERLVTSKPAKAVEHLQQIRTLINAATNQMYGLILDLRPSALDDLGLVAALKVYADRTMGGTGITYDLRAEGLAERLPAEIETTLYRVIQEGFTNIVRHSGANHVLLKLTRHSAGIEVEIADDGRGFDLAAVSRGVLKSQGLGLLGMRERVEQCHGHLDIATKPGQGVRIHIEIPTVEGDQVA